jgi:hypothetical protein
MVTRIRNPDGFHDAGSLPGGAKFNMTRFLNDHFSRAYFQGKGKSYHSTSTTVPFTDQRAVKSFSKEIG